MTRYDAVLSPVVRDPPPPLGLLAPTRPFDELSPAMFGYLGYTQLHNIVGAPAISLPLYWTGDGLPRSEEHTSGLQSLMRISYAVFCLQKKIKRKYKINN